MEDYFIKNKWKWTPYQRKGDRWIQEDFSIDVQGKHSDGAFRELLFSLRRIPGLVGQPGENKNLNVTYEHKFLIFLPREYPANLSHIKMRAATRIWHPRISMMGGGDACITVNGELDRILIDLIYHLLMDPRRIRPPKLYPKEDSGLNASAMRWFENDADNIHKFMLAKWDERHEKVALKDSGGIRIIGGDRQPTIDDSSKGTTIKIIPKMSEEGKELEEQKKRSKKGVRLI